MDVRELHRHFKAASWKSDEDVEAFLFVVPTDGLGSGDITQMLEILLNRRAASNAQAHARRCTVFARIADAASDKVLFAHYVRALKKADSRLRSVLVAALPKVNDVQEHAQLCALLKADDAELRRAAAEALKKVGGKTVLQMLQQLAGQADFPGRAEAIDVAMPIAGHYAIPILREVVSAGSPEERTKALRFLGDPHYMAKDIPGALKAMLGALSEANPRVLAQAIESFATLCSEDDFFEYLAPCLEHGNPAVVQATVRALRHFKSPQTLGLLEGQLRGGVQRVKMEVIATLEAIGDEAVLPLLVDVLGSKAMAVRNRAGEVLSKLSREGKVEVARVIAWLLRSPDVNVRRMAIEIARSVPDPNALWPKLLRLIRDDDWWVRERVMDVLIELAGKQLTPHMVALLQDPYDVIRRFAIDVISRLEDTQALGALVRTAREDSDWWAREKAIEAIACCGDPRAIPYVVELLKRDSETRVVSIQTLIKLQARDAVVEVAPLLEAEDADVRLTALNFLREFSASQHANAVQRLIADTDGRVSRLARELLAHWKLAPAQEMVSARDRAASFLDRMLIALAEAGADDLILAAGRPPYMKKLGSMSPLSSTAFSAEQVRALLATQLSITQLEALDGHREVDLSYEVKSEGLRFRANIFHLRGGIGAVFRIIKGDLARFEDLGLPKVMQSFGTFKHGLVLVGGPTGSGKSTTLAAIIDHINRTSSRHVISLEDPIEVVHASQKGLINQREIGTHTRSFGAALRSTLRQDPDVILVGEMRDLDTISFAVTAADTGHLIFGTVHTVAADTTVDRLLNAFPAAEQDQARSSIADNLKAVACQHLVRKKDGKGRTLAAEVMINNDAIASMIRKGKTFQIPSVIATSADAGMQSMDGELLRLYRTGVISAQEAYMKAAVKKDFEALVSEEADASGGPSGRAAPPAQPQAASAVAAAANAARPRG